MYEKLIEGEKQYLEEVSALRDKMRSEEQAKNERDIEYRVNRSKNYYAKQKILDDENHRRVMAEYEAQLEALEKKRDDDFRNLKYYCEIGSITEEEYYSYLAVLRDQYFEKGSADWQKYTLEIVEYERNAISEIANDLASHAEESLSEVVELKEKFQKKLTSGNMGLFGESTDTFKINGDVSQVTHTYFNNWEGEIYLMKKYREGLDGVKKKMGEIGFSDSDVKNFFTALTDLSFYDGIKFTGMLSGLSDEEFKKYISDYNEYLRLADEISTEVYAPEMDKAYDEIINTAKEKFAKLGMEIPEDFFKAGISGANRFSEGFLLEIQSFFKQLEMEINNFSAGLVSGISIGGNTANTNVNNYESNITINSSGTASRDINNYLAAEEINRQRWMV